MPGSDLAVAAQAEAPVNCLQALQAYGQRFGENEQCGYVNFKREAFPWGRAQDDVAQADVTKEEVMAVLEKDMGLQQGALKTEEPLAKPVAQVCSAEEVDSDGEELNLCMACKLPLGESCSLRMHAECQAQSVVQNMQNEEKKRHEADRRKKDQAHEEYGIGWSIDRVPCNKGPAAKLALREVPEGMVCLVLDEPARSIRVASTTEPAVAVNLEYLSIALEVKRREGHEPIFSLDPTGPEKDAMQEKVFCPPWLAGTSVGEVLFQADYHLKELSMGEYEQPVVGMKSCFDHSELEDSSQDWSAREWFIVRKAEVQICDSDALIPYVKMGVEAREQVTNGGELEDKVVTRLDHPMVKYAEEFTKNFDLIAERKSVVCHLRELAKAAILAKYLLESNAHLEETWFNLSSSETLLCSMEVPQLWNNRLHHVVEVQGAKGDRSKRNRTHGVYGGVNFGLSKFNLSRVPFAGRQLGAGLSATSAPLGAGLSLATSARGLAAPLARGVSGLSQAAVRGSESFSLMKPMAAVAKPSLGPLAGRAPITSLRPGPAPYLAAATIPSAGVFAVGAPMVPRIPAPIALLGALPQPAAGKPQPIKQDGIDGVDLRLDNFDLSSAKRVSMEAQSGGWSNVVKPVDECMTFGDAFWSSLESAAFKDDDAALLKAVFNPCLSDRRAEGDRFAPPDASYSHVAKLRSLVKEEAAVRQRRQAAFCSKDFVMSDPGILFPMSWTPTIACGKVPGATSDSRAVGALIERPEYEAQAARMLSGILKTTVPLFDKKTEDGMFFRVYRVGSLEVRTTQEHGSEETVCAIFSMRDSQAPFESAPQGEKIHQQAKIKKATEYVESTATGRGYYVVFQTEKGHRIRTERLADGRVTWEENPANLEDRNSLAKILRSKGCDKGTTVRDIQKRANDASHDESVSHSVCKLWARSTYNRVVEKPKKEEDPILAGKRMEKLALRKA